MEAFPGQSRDRIENTEDALTKETKMVHTEMIRPLHSG